MLSPCLGAPRGAASVPRGRAGACDGLRGLMAGVVRRAWLGQTAREGSPTAGSRLRPLLGCQSAPLCWEEKQRLSRGCHPEPWSRSRGRQPCLAPAPLPQLREPLSPPAARSPHRAPGRADTRLTGVARLSHAGCRCPRSRNSQTRWYRKAFAGKRQELVPAGEAAGDC